ncbi:hypothetical protein D1007_27426 [Hordeum vulgare]|nr:hypothetical protein D1007_27426 [Hordeum vulgare]
MKCLEKVQASPSPSVPPVRYNQWQAPPQNYVKCNVDAVVSTNGCFGLVGVVCRDAEGMYPRASGILFPFISDPRTLEALAAREALALVSNLYVHWLVVASDCSIEMDDIKKDNATSYGAYMKLWNGLLLFLL